MMRHRTSRLATKRQLRRAPNSRCHLSSGAQQQQPTAPYGLRFPDYSTPPPEWPLPPHPPMSRQQTILTPLLVGVFAMGMLYVYLHQDEEIYEYWQQVEQGNVPLDDDEEDDDE